MVIAVTRLAPLLVYDRVHFPDQSSLCGNRRRFGHLASVHETPSLKSQTSNAPGHPHKCCGLSLLHLDNRMADALLIFCDKITAGHTQQCLMTLQCHFCVSLISAVAAQCRRLL